MSVPIVLTERVQCTDGTFVEAGTEATLLTSYTTEQQKRFRPEGPTDAKLADGRVVFMLVPAQYRIEEAAR